MDDSPLRRWADGPHGPGCGDPLWRCKRCEAWTEDPRFDLASCPRCGYTGEPPAPTQAPAKFEVALGASYEVEVLSGGRWQSHRAFEPTPDGLALARERAAGTADFIGRERVRVTRVTRTPVDP